MTPRPSAFSLRRTTPAVALAIALALILGGVAVAIVGEHNYRQQKADELRVQTNILAATVTAAVAFGDHEAAQEYVDALQANPEIRAAVIYGPDGSPFVAYLRPGATPAPAHLAIGQAPGSGPCLAVAPVRQGGATLGMVYVRAETEPWTRRLERYTGVAILVVMASLIVAVLGIAQSTLARANAELESRAGVLADAIAKLHTQIAAREKAEEALRQSQKMEAIGQLTGGVAHDFNNLLQVVLGNLDLLRNASAGEPMSGRKLDAAIRAAERAAALTQQLLAFARRQPLAPRSLDVNALVLGMSNLLARSLGETIAVETELSPRAWHVFADANQLESALLNLAVNGRDAMRGEGTLTIATGNATLRPQDFPPDEPAEGGDFVAVSVRDTGAGMTDEVIAHAFEPFFTTKAVGQGTGLGLSQVYGFVKQSGGHVKIASRPGSGTVVTIYLPRVAAPRR
jgi:signal transduction histidine kinase